MVKQSMTCYKCGKRGYYVRERQERNLARGQERDRDINQFQFEGRVNGVPCKSIQLDSGRSKMSAHSQFVSEAMQTGESMVLRSANGEREPPTHLLKW